MESGVNNLQGENSAIERDNAAKSAVPQKSWLQQNKALLIALMVMFLLLTTSGIALGVYTWDNGVMAEGVSINAVPIGQLTFKEAERKLETKINDILNQSLAFNVEGTVVSASLGDLGLTVSAQNALEQAYKLGREGNLAQRAVDKHNASLGVDFALSPSWNEQRLEEKLNSLFAEFNIPAVNAEFTLTPANTMDIKKDKAGRKIPIASLMKQIKEINVYKPENLAVRFEDDLPTLTAAELEAQKITGRLSSYTTKFIASQVNRSENVRVAAKALDGVVIKPGETFSFNEIVGERTVDAGYKDALVIVNGEFVPGLGGGVCQVSSTLYNSLLLANLHITERSNHSLAIAYAPLGRDATVAYPVLDLKFKNDSGGYLLIRSKISGNTLTFDLYGKQKPGQVVELSTVTESVIPAKEQRRTDKTLPPGKVVVKQHGSPGYVISTYRTVKVNGKVVKKESLGKSIYQPTPRIVVVGS